MLKTLIIITIAVWLVALLLPVVLKAIRSRKKGSKENETN